MFRYLVLGLVCSTAQAEFTLDQFSLSTGESWIQPFEDGRWRQDGGQLDWWAERYGTEVAISLGGKTPVSFIDWTLEYVDRGSYKGGGTFTSDTLYLAGQFVPIYKNTWVQSTHGVVLSLDPTYRTEKVDIFMRLGVEYYHSDISFDGVSCNVPTYKTKVTHTEHNYVPYFGLGVRLKFEGYSLFVEGHAAQEYVLESAARRKDFFPGIKAGLSISF